ncbi:MAG: sulfite exporter TauE/SafE family protein [Fluviicoccus sp.]|uniref:sulfite exporter TauE/SafE family protein n=1 Tax=Fluviicoccus sp. TaxID=2003552 RepID=UPI00271FD7CE|nr:sulfite exporter TauE/SafE family protein [Fluviicoccus sp.]MDO8330442.1 sulfite exporter TauE/SafE family protein [Fluviicoccus sp.]
MNESLILVTALAAGFFGSPHCLGMCGGIVSALGFALQSQTPARRLALQSLYHLGRLLSYSLLGLLVGLMGKGILAPLANSRWPYVLTAAMMILFGLYLTGWWRGLDRLEALGARLWQAMAPLRQRFVPINTLPRALFAGMLWGFLPCGLVYSALALAMTSGNALTSGTTMMAFGLGTLPMMLMTGSAAAELKTRLQEQGWRTANGLLVVAFGLWTLLQAMQHGAGSHQHHGRAMPGQSTMSGHQHAAGPAVTAPASATPPAMTAPAADMNNMDGMDHSQHHMPGMEMPPPDVDASAETPAMDHSQHHMP